MALFENQKYEFTNHARVKMRQYGITESRVKRIIRYPERTEETVIEKAIAAMQKTGGKKDKEMWVMYLIGKSKIKSQKSKNEEDDEREGISNFSLPVRKIKVITAWRYPGVSPRRNPIPDEVLAEVRDLL